MVFLGQYEHVYTFMDVFSETLLMDVPYIMLFYQLLTDVYFPIVRKAPYIVMQEKLPIPNLSTAKPEAVPVSLCMAPEGKWNIATSSTAYPVIVAELLIYPAATILLDVLMKTAIQTMFHNRRMIK